MGSHLSVSSNDFNTTLNVKSLSDNLPETLKIAEEHLLHPKFDENEFAYVKDQIIQSIKNNKKEASVTASQVMRLLLFGEQNNFAHPNTGYTTSIESLSLDSIKPILFTPLPT